MQWLKSSYFWITLALIVVSVYGFAMGSDKITDPGQPIDNLLPLWYLAAAGIIAVNGYLSHKHYQEQKKLKENDDEKE